MKCTSARTAAGSANHPENPWERLHAYPCGGAGAPCPVCHGTNNRHAPQMPEGFKTEVGKDGWRH
jgi:hypothetical protein